LGGLGAGAGAAAGLGALCGVVAMPSVYGEGRRETSDLEHNSEESADEELLQRSHTFAVRDTPLAVRLGDPQQIDIWFIPVDEGGLVELLGVDAEPEVPGGQHEDRAGQRADRTDDSDAHQQGVRRVLGERETVID
jgi:hypothetical protein